MDPLNRIKLTQSSFYGLMHINGSIDLKQRCPTFGTFDPGEVGTDYVDDTFEVSQPQRLPR